MRRFITISQIKADQTHAFTYLWDAEKQSMRRYLIDSGVRICEIFRYRRYLFTYVETVNTFTEFSWQRKLGELMELWPAGDTPNNCFPMTDIFHYQDVDSFRGWRQSYVPERKIGLLARLKPDRVSSYIYYHYLRQEEMPGSGNRTYIIGYSNPYIFSYQEHPAVVDRLPPRMESRLVPEDWNAVMDPHFDKWKDADENQKIWRSLEHVFSL